MNHQNLNTAKPAHSLALLARLWRDYLSAYWPRLMLALVAMAALALTLGAMPFVVEAINAAFIDGPPSSDGRFRPSLAWITRYGALILAALGLAYGLAQYAQSRLTLGAALDSLRDIQNHMFSRYLALDLASQRQHPTGVLTSHFTNDVQLLRETLTRTTNGVRDLMQLIALCAALIFYDVVLFAAVLLVYGVLGWPIAWLGKKLRAAAAEAQSQTGNLAASIGEVASGAVMVKTYNLESDTRARTKALFATRTMVLKKAAFLRAVNEPFIFFVGAIAIGLVVSIISARVASGAIDAPQIAGFLVALLLLSQPARSLGTLYGVVQEGLAAFERMLIIIDSKPAILDAPDAKPLHITNAAITFENVAFAYEGLANTLEDISLTIAPGTSLALVGASGAGKTTLTHLLPRLYDITAGNITIDGHDIRACTLASLRSSMAIVAQDVVIFNQSLRDNIAFGQPGASDAAIARAAKAAALDQFISALPEGYATLAGENGNRLSGGQRQRIAIARAFLKDAPILILDEPTSALDSEAEAIIQGALETLRAGRTTLIIAHRLTTIRNADMIAVMERGRIIEQGTHAELIKTSGAYARLVALQFDN